MPRRKAKVKKKFVSTGKSAMKYAKDAGVRKAKKKK